MKNRHVYSLHEKAWDLSSRGSLWRWLNSLGICCSRGEQVCFWRVQQSRLTNNCDYKIIFFQLCRRRQTEYTRSEYKSETCGHFFFFRYLWKFSHSVSFSTFLEKYTVVSAKLKCTKTLLKREKSNPEF